MFHEADVFVLVLVEGLILEFHSDRDIHPVRISVAGNYRYTFGKHGNSDAGSDYERVVLHNTFYMASLAHLLIFHLNLTQP